MAHERGHHVPVPVDLQHKAAMFAARTHDFEKLVRRTRQELAAAIFEWIEAWYNPARRHSALGYHSPVTYERMHQMLPTAAA